MKYLQTIYFNDKPLVLCTDADAYMNDHAHAKNYTLFHGAHIRNFNLALQQMEMPGVKGCILEDGSAVAIQECLHNLYTPIDAGGGLVYAENGSVLLIYRRGKWDLPKGKLDAGETMEQCAIREVCEETGLKGLKLISKITDTYHIYTQHDELMLKRTSWYTMRASASEKLRPQKEEQIMEAKWVAPADLAPYADKSYEAVREVLRLAGLL
jgi:ADP-ribose pyrophosphatase YjhB (NUDIX family)